LSYLKSSQGGFPNADQFGHDLKSTLFLSNFIRTFKNFKQQNFVAVVLNYLIVCFDGCCGFPGVFGGSSSLMSIIVSAEVCLSNGRIVSWTWEKDPAQMKALCCGLGMIAVVLSLTLKCVPLQR
jgi:hypothetical protein